MPVAPKSKVKEYLKSQMPIIREQEKKLRDLIVEIEMLQKAGVDVTEIRNQWQQLVKQYEQLRGLS
jgi:hypothetical protein